MWNRVSERTRPARKRGLGWALVLALCIGVGLDAQGTLTFPDLVITNVDSQAGAKGILVRVTGTFPFDDLIQQPYPLQLFIRHVGVGDDFVRYCMASEVTHGKDKAFKRGLDERGVRKLEKVGRKNKQSTTATILQVSPWGIRVRLPDKFPSGPAEAQLYIIYNGAPIFSNPFPFEIEKERW